MLFKSKILSAILLILIVYRSFSQEVADSSVFATMFSASYMYQIPDGDLATRFGANSNIGGSFMVKFKSNIILGVEWNSFFGNKLKEEVTSIFDAIKTSTGDIIDQNGEYATILLSERGFFTGVKVGKIFPVLFGVNNNSGLFISGSLGLLQHKIRIENDGNRAPQILNDFKKGYDKLTNGLAVSEFIGYMYIGESQILNFYAGFEFYQAWTQSRRDFDFGTMQVDTQKRLDMLHSFKIGWVIPLYKRLPDKYYYF